MGNVFFCGGRSSESGKSIHWTTTNVPLFQGGLGSENQEFQKVKSKIKAIQGKSIFGVYHSNEGNMFFVAWDSPSAFKTAKAELVKAIGDSNFTEAQLGSNTTEWTGHIWETSNDVEHHYDGANKEGAVLGLARYKLSNSSHLALFKEGMNKKAAEMGQIQGKGHWGWYGKEGEDAPYGFVFWDTPETKEHGKSVLWNHMMATPDEGTPSDPNHSIHVMASGGMFKCDSDRSYHQAYVVGTPDAM